MGHMFFGCNSLRSIDLSNFDTSKVKYMGSMFCGCYSLKSLPGISEWDTENVTNMGYMFDSCKSLTKLKFKNKKSEKKNLKKNETIEHMFYG